MASMHPVEITDCHHRAPELGRRIVATDRKGLDRFTVSHSMVATERYANLLIWLMHVKRTSPALGIC